MRAYRRGVRAPFVLLGAMVLVWSGWASGNEPGELLEAKPFTDVDPAIRALGAEALRVRYRSTSDFEPRSTIVSGVIFIPAGTPPEGGWPVLAHAHGTTGIRPECGPSLSTNLWGATVLVTAYLKAGYAVAAADYQGLGAPGIHPYLDAKVAGWNVIDSVRALRRARPGIISDRWVTIGGSQGGGASWAAAEQASTYAPELHLVAAVNEVPAADIAGYAQKAADGALTRVQGAAYSALLFSLSRVHPDLDMNLYRRGSVAANWDALSMCYGPRMQERNDAVTKIEPGELKPATPRATRALQNLLSTMALPQKKAAAPMLVIYAGQDEYIEAAWTRKAIAAACEMGTQIEADFQPTRSHGTFDGSHVLEWLSRRMAGEPVQNACKS